MKSTLPGIPGSPASISRYFLQALFVAALIGASLSSAHAWSSAASKTQYDLKALELAISTYHADYGKLPSPETFQEEIKEYVELRAFRDRWNRPFVYRVPGLHGGFDLYSVGPDGIDNARAGDDVTAAGVNDGYHWKATWPQGRRIVTGAFITGALCLLLGRFFPWSLVVPAAGLITCGGLLWGTSLLARPGIGSSDGELSLIVLVMVVFLFFLIRNLRSPSASTAKLPNFLTAEQIRDLLSPLGRDLKLPIARFYPKRESAKKHASEMTVEELEGLIVRSIAGKHLSGGNLEVRLPSREDILIGNHEGLYWLELSPRL